jgi:hypothetical protein
MASSHAAAKHCRRPKDQHQDWDRNGKRSEDSKEERDEKACHSEPEQISKSDEHQSSSCSSNGFHLK